MDKQDKTGTEIEDEIERQPMIGEEEARALLKEEKRLAELEYDNAHKRNKKALIIVIVVAVVLCLLGAVFAAIMANRGGDEKQEDQDSSATVPAEDDKPAEGSEEAPKDNDGVVKATVTKVEAALKSYLNEGEEWFVFEDEDSTRPLYQSSTMKAATSLNRSFGFIGNSTKEYGDEDFEEVWAKIGDGKLEEAVRKVLADDGFVEVGQDWNPVPEMINYETGVICTGIGSGLPLYFGCGHISWLDAEKVNLINALAEAYNAKEGHFVGSLDAEVANIKDSEVKPYQTISANLFGAAGLFYRTSPEAEWKFFMGTQSVLACDDYDTEELRNAYAGEVCYDTEKNEDSVVTATEK